MTGFANIEGSAEDGRGFSLAIKGVNHRHLDLAIRLPNGLDALERELRRILKSEIRRGHVELTLVLHKASSAVALQLDEALLHSLFEIFQASAHRLNLSQQPDLHELLRMPGVLTTAPVPLETAAVEQAALIATAELLARFNAARALEGQVLASELIAGMTRLADLVDEARSLRERVAPAEFARLKARLAELTGEIGVSDERLLAEAALLAGRGDVQEELVRLRTHLERFTDIVKAGGEVGRPLDFLLQELNREANTMLSKTGASAGEAGFRLTEIGLEIKTELERAREQVQNLE